MKAELHDLRVRQQQGVACRARVRLTAAGVPVHKLQHSGRQQGTCSAGDMPRSAGRPSVVPMPHKLRPLVCVHCLGW